jgi:hypothetical protein
MPKMGAEIKLHSHSETWVLVFLEQVICHCQNSNQSWKRFLTFWVNDHPHSEWLAFPANGRRGKSMAVLQWLRL